MTKRFADEEDALLVQKKVKVDEIFNEFDEHDESAKFAPPENVAALREMQLLRAQNAALEAECNAMKMSKAMPVVAMREFFSIHDMPTDARIAVIVSRNPIASGVLDHLVTVKAKNVQFVLNRVDNTVYASQKQSVALIELVSRCLVSLLRKKINSYRSRRASKVTEESAPTDTIAWQDLCALVDVRGRNAVGRRRVEHVVNALCAHLALFNVAVDEVGLEEFVDAALVEDGVFLTETANRMKDHLDAAVRALRLVQAICHGFRLEGVDAFDDGTFDAAVGTKSFRYGTLDVNNAPIVLTNGFPVEFLALLSVYVQKLISTNNKK